MLDSFLANFKCCATFRSVVSAFAGNYTKFQHINKFIPMDNIRGWFGYIYDHQNYKSSK